MHQAGKDGLGGAFTFPLCAGFPARSWENGFSAHFDGLSAVFRVSFAVLRGVSAVFR